MNIEFFNKNIKSKIQIDNLYSYVKLKRLLNKRSSNNFFCNQEFFLDCNNFSCNLKYEPDCDEFIKSDIDFDSESKDDP